MLEFIPSYIGFIIVSILIGLVIISVLYFCYYLYQVLVALMRCLTLWWRINTEKEKQEMKNPVKILKIRYAKGEIIKEEYEEMKKVLEK